MSEPAPKQTRIQRKNRETILQAALDAFSTHGFRGATLDQIAEGAGLSKPNLLYYFPSKEAIHASLLDDLLVVWLQPLRDISPAGDPMTEVLTYVRRKLEMSRSMPRESRLFANEILQGAPRIGDTLGTSLKDLVDEKALILEDWMREGRLSKVCARHLIVSIWALTQHYADFEIQVRTVLGEARDPLLEAEGFLDMVFQRLLQPQGPAGP